MVCTGDAPTLASADSRPHLAPLGASEEKTCNRETPVLHLVQDPESLACADLCIVLDHMSFKMHKPEANC